MDFEEFWKGIIKKNAVLSLTLGLCPVLAITTRLENAIGMSFAVLFVIISSNLIVSAIRDFVPEQVRIPSFIVIIASLVTVIELMLHGYSPGLYKNLGIFLPLIVVNCMIMGRAEAFASRHDVLDTLLDSAGIGTGFALTIILVGSIREFLGTGGLEAFGYQLVPQVTSAPVSVMLLPPGAFLTIGVLLGVLRKFGVMKNE